MFKIVKYGLIIIAVFIIFFPAIRSILVVNEKPEVVDVIIVLSGEAGRLEKAAELYHADYADRVMLSLATEKGTTPEEAVEFGISEKHLILEKKATSTYTNALYTKEKIEEYNINSAIVVSSDYHMQRVELVFDRVYSDSGIKLIYVASPPNEHTKDRTPHNILFIAKEFIKLVGYWLGLYKFIDL
ncbi:YdcF family protein [Bacillus thermotolerans]|uniref:DUF218 domain-containing protein n=1 Tax=Bacillus thermotolerans TaxID=1221996 RepID=A0A0F5I5T4_BACTR|nr:YdcF family protein [Bacillus thermotolerans]KKB40901.1 hypothetical protein QY95_00964 [Bacillus thermotolerans]